MSKVITNEAQLNTEVDDLVTEDYALEVLGLKNPADFRKFSRSFMKLSKIVKGIDDSNNNKLDKGGYNGTAKNINDELSKKATKTQLGRIIVGDNLTVDSNGKLSGTPPVDITGKLDKGTVPEKYNTAEKIVNELDKKASATELGRVKIGQNLSITADGVLNGNPAYTHPTGNGYSHLPVNGATGQFIKYSSAGNGQWAKIDWGDITGKPSTFTPTNHTHDDRYFTETEINDKLGEKLDKGAVSSEYDTAKKIEDKIKTAQGTADNKLDKDGYSGTAQSLKNEIDGKVSKIGDTINGVLTINNNTSNQLKIAMNSVIKGEVDAHPDGIILYNNKSKQHLKLFDNGRVYIGANNLDTETKEVIGAINGIKSNTFYMKARRILYNRWCRVFQVDYDDVVGSSLLISLHATRANTVYNITMLLQCTHTARVNIFTLGNTYTNPIKIRVDVKTNGAMVFNVMDLGIPDEGSTIFFFKIIPLLGKPPHIDFFGDNTDGTEPISPDYYKNEFELSYNNSLFSSNEIYIQNGKTQVAHFNDKKLLSGYGIDNVNYIQDEGQKTIGEGYFDKVTGKFYRCINTNNDTDVTGNFVLASILENAEPVKILYQKLDDGEKISEFLVPEGYRNGYIYLVKTYYFRSDRFDGSEFMMVYPNDTNDKNGSYYGGSYASIQYNKSTNMIEYNGSGISNVFFRTIMAIRYI